MKRILLVSLVVMVGFSLAGCPALEQSQANQEKVKELKQQRDQLRQERDQLQERLAELEAKEEKLAELEQKLGELEEISKEDITRKGDYVFIILGERVLFDTARTELTEEAKQTLDSLASVIQEYPDREVRVEGHADSRPILSYNYANNWELAADRAIKVARYLQNETPIDGDRLAATTFGDQRPRYPNTSEKNMRKNRRVEIVLYPPDLPKEERSP